MICIRPNQIFVPTERNCLSLRVVASSYHNHSPLWICFLRLAHLQLLSLPLYTTRWGKGGHTLIQVFQIPVRQPALIETLQSPQNTVLLTPSPVMFRTPLPWRGKRGTWFQNLHKGEMVGPIQYCTFRAYPSWEHSEGESASLIGLTKRNANAPSFPSKTERTGDRYVQYTDSDNLASANPCENNDCFDSSALQRKLRMSSSAWNAFPFRHASSVSPSPNRQTAGPSYGLRLEELDSIAKDIQQFNPKDSEFNVQSYLTEIDHCLSDLLRPTDREKGKLIWKT